MVCWADRANITEGLPLNSALHILHVPIDMQYWIINHIITDAFYFKAICGVNV